VVEGVDVFGVVPHAYRDIYVQMGDNASGFMLKSLPRDNVTRAHLEEIGSFVTDQLAQFDADVIHLNSFISALYVEDQRPIVVTNHENRHEYATYLGQNFFDYMAKLVYTRQTQMHHHSCLTAPSKYYAREYAEAFSLEVDGYNLGVCLDNFPVPEDRRRLSRRRSPGQIQILLPSRLKFWQKGHDLALNAAAILEQRGVSFHVVFSGVNENYRKAVDELFQMAEARQIRQHISAQRFSKIQEAYKSADVVISPERYCSYGLSISEALSCAVPTVLSRIPTYEEIASGYEHAIFFQNEDANDLAHQIVESQKVDQETLVDEAIRFRETYDLRNSARNFSQLYRRLSHSEV
jgi:glycosyltransferase involved in cell wall biosynthesis